MGDRKVRILMAKFGEGYEAAVMRLASTFRDAGFEVIYTELQDPAAIVASAIQESVDHIGVTTVTGARIENFAEIYELLSKENCTEIGITAGGILPDEDVTRIKGMGVVEFFPQGTSYTDLIEWAKANIKPTQ